MICHGRFDTLAGDRKQFADGSAVAADRLTQINRATATAENVLISLC
jgi:hypothetical protein